MEDEFPFIIGNAVRVSWEKNHMFPALKRLIVGGAGGVTTKGQRQNSHGPNRPTARGTDEM